MWSDFVDSQGAITNLLEGTIAHDSVITSKKGAVRENHYHKEDIQYIYLIGGRYESFSKDVEKPNGPVERIVEPEDLVMTRPMVAHGMVFLEDSIFVAMYTVPRDKIGYTDTYPHTF